MAIHILDRKSEPVEIIDSCIPQESAIQAAREKVREAAMLGITLTAVNEDGENVFDAAFETFIKFIPHGQRIASRILDRMAHNPADVTNGAKLIQGLICSSEYRGAYDHF
ncbi:hypothetical protein HMI78_005199 [Salmonella enterica]|nr:hypothetical protein [Salmonella enterica]